MLLALRQIVCIHVNDCAADRLRAVQRQRLILAYCVRVQPCLVESAFINRLRHSNVDEFTAERNCIESNGEEISSPYNESILTFVIQLAIVIALLDRQVLRQIAIVGQILVDPIGERHLLLDAY